MPQMYRKHHNGQLSIEEFHVPFGGTLDPENRWVLFSSLMPWEELEATYAPQFSPTTGAPAKPVRLAFGALFIKQRLGLTDEETVEQAAVPVGLVLPDKTKVAFGEELIKPILAESMDVRKHLADWLPITLRMTNLNLLYSTNHHGRTLERFYNQVKDSKHTVLICEAFVQGMSSKPTIIGLYASQAWRPSTKVYGDGACFLFRLDPDPKRWKWTPKGSGSSIGNTLDSVDLENDNNQIALLEQFMVSTNNYISMGGNSDGSAGLRINEDLTRGESSSAAGFDNEPLHGKGNESVFEIGLVEVYGLIRQIDGRAV
jgi:hypothetical protein